MNKDIKPIIVYIIIAVVIITGCIGFRVYKEELLLGSIKDTLQKYFEDNNTHIAAHDFNINNVKIRCKGNDAYIVDFNLLIDDSASSKFNKLGATIYKSKNVWHVKGFGAGLTTDELKLYNFRCYN